MLPGTPAGVDTNQMNHIRSRSTLFPPKPMPTLRFAQPLGSLSAGGLVIRSAEREGVLAGREIQVGEEQRSV
jgi:hypothetical protein